MGIIDNFPVRDIFGCHLRKFLKKNHCQRKIPYCQNSPLHGFRGSINLISKSGFEVRKPKLTIDAFSNLNQDAQPACRFR